MQTSLAALRRDAKRRLQEAVDRRGRRGQAVQRQRLNERFVAAVGSRVLVQQSRHFLAFSACVFHAPSIPAARCVNDRLQD